MKRVGIFSLGALCLMCSCSRAAVQPDSADSTARIEELASGPAQATLLFVGDAMQHQAQLDRARELGGGDSWDYTGYFTLLEPEIKGADYAIVNLETPLGGGKGGYTGFPCFSAPDEFAVALKDAGFDLFLTANNHTLDRGDYGLRRTLSALDSLKVDHIGTYRDKAEREKLVPFVREVNGIRIGFLNYSYGTNGIAARDGAEVSLIDKETMAREMKKAREAGAELLVVMPHWGVEYVLNENEQQRDLARYLIDQGADLIIGSHPHVVQPMRVVRSDRYDKDVLVVYSLGNFVSNMKTGDTRGGAMVTVVVERDAQGDAHFSSAAYDTFYAAKPDGSARSNFRVIPSWHASEIPASQRGWWNTFDSSARRLFSRENVNVPAAEHK